MAPTALQVAHDFIGYPLYRVQEQADFAIRDNPVDPELDAVLMCMRAVASFVYGNRIAVSAMLTSSPVPGIYEQLTDDEYYGFTRHQIASALQMLSVLYLGGELAFGRHIENVIANWKPSPF